MYVGITIVIAVACGHRRTVTIFGCIVNTGDSIPTDVIPAIVVVISSSSSDETRWTVQSQHFVHPIAPFGQIIGVVILLGGGGCGHVLVGGGDAVGEQQRRIILVIVGE